MARTTGPIVVAGGMTWANQTLFQDPMPTDWVDNSMKIMVATGALAVLFYGIERVSPEIAVPLAWTALVTSLVVRFNNKKTPLERGLELVA